MSQASTVSSSVVSSIGLPQLKANNLYLLDWMVRHNAPNFTALDYGCGDGGLVFTARDRGVNCYGAETYYDGARPEDLELVRKFDPQATFVRTINNNKLDFPDAFFDMVVANQVFEHIADLSGTAAEISRVLKPGGQLVSLFPIKGVIREPHVHIPFIHRFPKNKLRRVYFKVARSMSKKVRSMPWGVGEAGVDKAFWFLDTHVFYRTPKQIREIFEPKFEMKLIDPHWLAYRLPKLSSKFKSVPGSRSAATLVSRLGAGLSMVCKKKG